MADNVAITPGSGATCAADDIGGVLYQRMKVSIGADGEAADLDSGQKTMANSVPVTLASDQAGETHLGEMSPNATSIAFTLSLDTSAYHAGDVLAATQEIADCLRVNGGASELVSLVVLDKDDNTAAPMTFYFFNASATLGTENAAISISDSDAAKLIGVVTIPASAWVDLINSKAAVIPNIGLLLKGAGASTSLWMAASTGGTPTQTASGITGHLTFIRY